MFRTTQDIYDGIYHWKDYEAESQKLRELIAHYLQAPGRSLLDMACGTGRHLEHLHESFEVEGADLDTGFLEIARSRLPGVSFYEADLGSFDLGRQYDVVTCLFSSIGYLTTLEQLAESCRCFARHVVPGGLAMIEPWLQPDEYQGGPVHVDSSKGDGPKICRMSISELNGRVTVVTMHHLIGEPDSIRHEVERHELFMATREELTECLEDAGFEVFYDTDGLMGRGLYVARRRAEA